MFGHGSKCTPVAKRAYFWAELKLSKTRAFSAHLFSLKTAPTLRSPMERKNLSNNK